MKCPECQLVNPEAVKFCGFGAEIAASMMEQAFDVLGAPVKRVGAPFTPVPFSPVLEPAYLPNRQKIAAAVEEVCTWRRNLA